MTSDFQRNQCAHAIERMRSRYILLLEQAFQRGHLRTASHLVWRASRETARIGRA